MFTSVERSPVNGDPNPNPRMGNSRGMDSDPMSYTQKKLYTWPQENGLIWEIVCDA